MCDAEPQEREWYFYVQDMLEFGERALTYTDGLDQSEFTADSRTYDATLRNIELIGEAATHIPEDVRESNPEIPWRDIIGVRNRLAHGYLHISNSVVWSIVQDAIPELLPQLRRLLDSIDRGQR